MTIVFDIFLDNHELVERAKSTPEVNACLQEIYSFVADKLEPLKSEINLEERDEEGEPKGTIIFLEVSGGPASILGFHGYSQVLSLRMLACFVEEDFRYIIQRIEFLRTKVRI